MEFGTTTQIFYILTFLLFHKGDAMDCCLQINVNGSNSFHVNNNMCNHSYTWYENGKVVAYDNAVNDNNFLSQDYRSITFNGKTENVSYRGQCDKKAIGNEIQCNNNCPAHAHTKDELVTKSETFAPSSADIIPPFQNNKHFGVAVAMGFVVLLFVLCVCVIAWRKKSGSQRFASWKECWCRRNYSQATQEPAVEPP